MATCSGNGRERATRILILARAKPRLVWRLARRLEQEAPGATIAGLLYQAPALPLRTPGDSLRATVRSWFDLALRWAHACPASARPECCLGVEDLVLRCRESGWPILVSEPPASARAHDFVREQNPDLALVLYEGVFPEELLFLPRGGSLIVRARPELPPEAGATPPFPGRPLGLHLAVLRARREGDPLSVVSSHTLASEPYDTPASLELKADLLVNDLLVRSLTALTPEPVPPGGPPPVPEVPPQTFPASYRGSAPPPSPSPVRTLPARAKTGLAVLLLSPYWIVRNWWRRLRGRFPVIILFHHLVSDRPHHLGMSTHAFLRAVQFLQKHYQVVSLSKAVQLLASGSVKAPTVVLTFDDGYGENFLTVRAVMEETEVPVTFFLSSGVIGQPRPFPHDQVQGETQFPPLTWEQVEYLARNGVEIGSHTCSHFDCGSQDGAALVQEILGSKIALERRLRRRVRFFAFPWGHPENMSPEAIEIARATYPYLLAAHGGGNWADRPDPSGILQRTFQSAGLWELQFGLQSVGDLGLSLLRSLALRFHRREAPPDPIPQGRDA